jgi:hypothetical protein
VRFSSSTYRKGENTKAFAHILCVFLALSCLKIGPFDSSLFARPDNLLDWFCDYGSFGARQTGTPKKTLEKLL